MKLKKIAGLMMACVMAVSCLAVSASAAELEEQAMSIEGSENVYVVGGVATLREEQAHIVVFALLQPVRMQETKHEVMILLGHSSLLRC